MLVKIDFQSEIPLYLQLKNQIVEGMASGALKPGEALPSVRLLASDLGINLHTVNKTYSLLKQDGFITVHRQKGVVVNPPMGEGYSEDFTSKLRGDLRPLAAEAFCRGMCKEEFDKLCDEIFATFKLLR